MQVSMCSLRACAQECMPKRVCTYTSGSSLLLRSQGHGAAACSAQDKSIFPLSWFVALRKRQLTTCIVESFNDTCSSHADLWILNETPLCVYVFIKAK